MVVIWDTEPCIFSPKFGLFSGQGRLDGAFCDYTEQEKMEYMESIHKQGVVNIEMESLAFAALTHHAGIKSAVVCVALLDRLHGDQVNRTHSIDKEIQNFLSIFFLGNCWHFSEIPF